MTRMATARVFTIGHSTRPLDDFVSLLRDAGVSRLIDVRSFPRSRTNPQFNIDSLPDMLERVGIGYRHAVELGGRRGKQKLPLGSPNTYWRNDSFRNYADYALGLAFRDGFQQLLREALDSVSAIMCAEVAWQRCHRQIITDYLITAGVDVVHIIDTRRREPAILNPAASHQADGSLHYVAAQGKLL